MLIKSKMIYKPLKLALENRLNDKLPYNITLNDVLRVVEYINSKYQYNIDDYGYDGCPIFSQDARTEFPLRTDQNGKRFWVFNKVMNILLEEDILWMPRNYFSGESINTKFYHKKTKAKIYEYTTEFLESLSHFAFGITFEDLPINDKSLIGKVQTNKKVLRDTHYVLKNKLKLMPNVYEKMIKEIREEYENKHFFETPMQIEKRVFIALSKINNVIIPELLTVVEGEHNHRIYHSFNMLNSIFRKYFTIDDEELFEIDLKSAQPFIFASILLKKVKDGEISDENIQKDISKFYEIVTNQDIYLFLKKKYYELNGTYKYKKTYYNSSKTNNYIDLSDRDIVKEEFFTFLYKKYNQGFTTFDGVIKKEFPYLFKYVKTLRNDYLKRAKTTSGKHNLAVELQKEEVNIFVEGTKHLIKEGALTIHDAIICKKSMKDKVYNSLQNKLKEKELYNATLVEKNICYYENENKKLEYVK